MYSLKYNLKIGTQNLFQNFLINNLFVIIILNNKKSIYIEKENKIYSIHSETSELKVMDFSIFHKQNEFISKSIGEINIDKQEQNQSDFGFKLQAYNYTNIDKSFNCQIKTICIPDFDDTAYKSYFNFNMKNQLLKILLKSNELLSYNKTELNFNQVKQVVETELVSIDKIEIPNEFLNILDFKIINNEGDLY